MLAAQRLDRVEQECLAQLHAHPERVHDWCACITGEEMIDMIRELRAHRLGQPVPPTFSIESELGTIYGSR